MEYIFEYKSPIGIIIITSDETEITGLRFKGESETEVLSDKKYKETSAIKETKRWLDIYFSGKNPGYIPAINATGTEFQKLVWKILLEIPYGKTTTYGEIAGKIAEIKNVSRMSAQAVGGAVGKNPIAIIIPCHRVIGKKGKLTGYAYGIDKKIALLEIERADIKNYYGR
ncbi:MAG: methylated-DNA--[protein]-cysteine S-methyltransferase [Ezakiella sp.]